MKNPLRMLQWSLRKLRLRVWLTDWYREWLMASRERFERFIYTDLQEALKLLDLREMQSLYLDIPPAFHGKKKAVIYRQIATPNFELARFLTLVPEDFQPLVLEYHDDKFTSQNELKHAAGKMHFYSGFGKKGGMKIEAERIIDFTAHDGKRIRDVVTMWGQPLVDFHRELFTVWEGHKREVSFFEASEWFRGAKALDYYNDFLRVFIKNGVLFENFMLESGKERVFIKQVVLPAFMRIYSENGLRPLIVSLAPTGIEGEKFWTCYPKKIREVVRERLLLQD